MYKILLIEDDGALRRAMRIVLEKSGYEVYESSDGGEGLRMAENQLFDLVVSDIIMPNVEGLGTIFALHEKYPSMPIIGMSGGGRVSSVEYLKTARMFGAVKTLEKPFELDDLCTMVADIFSSHQS